MVELISTVIPAGAKVVFLGDGEFDGTALQATLSKVGWSYFSDQKSRGFHLHKSHISDPQRLSRLLIAACLAYIWIVY